MSVKVYPLQIGFVCILGMLFCSCSQAKYGHLTSHTTIKKNSKLVQRHTKTASNVLHLNLDGKRALAFHSYIPQKLHINNIDNQHITKDLSQAQQYTSLIKTHQIVLGKADIQPDKMPEATQSAGEFFGGLLMLGLVSFLVAAIASLFGMAFWHAYLLSMIFSILILLWAME